MIRRSRLTGSPHTPPAAAALKESFGTNPPLFAYRTLLGYNGSSAPSELLIVSSFISVRRESHAAPPGRPLLAAVKSESVFGIPGGPYGRIA
jgi:hypothetical protein